MKYHTSILKNCCARVAVMTTLGASAIFVVFGGQTALAQSGTTERISIGTLGQEANRDCFASSVSGDGTLVAFETDATSLTVPATNGFRHILLRDRSSGTTTCVSVNSSGAQGQDHSFRPSVSLNGRYVAFASEARNLASNDFNGSDDIFVHDLVTGETFNVSVSSTGEQGDDDSCDPSISADGRMVVYQSEAPNLVPGDTLGFWDVFVRDRQTTTTTRVSVSTAGAQGNGNSRSYNDARSRVSPDGRFVVFESVATNLVFGDTNGVADIFVRDRDTDADGLYDEPGSVSTVRVSVSSGGGQGNGKSSEPSIASGGRFVAFRSSADNLVSNDSNGSYDIFVHDRDTDTDGVFDEPGAISTIRVSVSSAGQQGNSDSHLPAICADGHSVAFQSWAGNLVGGDTNSAHDIFVHDMRTQETWRVSLRQNGGESGGACKNPAISSGGRFVTFRADSLVPDDLNSLQDIYLRDRLLASATFRNAGTNPASYVAATMSVLGSTYTGVIDVGGTTGHTHALLAGYGARLTFPFAGWMGLVDPGGPEYLGLPAAAGPVATINVPIPGDPAYAGYEVYTQAAHFGGGQPFALSNAQDLILGF